MHPTSFRFVAALALLLVSATSKAQVPSGRAADSSSIRAAIERGARGFERAQPDSILAHYARDIILSYPGIPDQDYATLVRGYAELRDRPATVRATTTPTFDEILVDGNLAVVRLRWTTTIRSGTTATTAPVESTRYLRDLQVWRREANGEWRFFRGMHYRDSTAAPARR
jgi:ketosteroid isomerase-like protein